MFNQNVQKVHFLSTIWIRNVKGVAVIKQIILMTLQ